MATQPVTVRLLDREFLVGCSDEERAGLIASADLLDKRMRELRNSAGNPGFDRIAVLVALSITHELLSLQQQNQSREQALGSSIDALTRKLEAALNHTGNDAA